MIVVFICIHPVTDDFERPSYAFLPAVHLPWQSFCVASSFISGAGCSFPCCWVLVLFILDTSPLWERWFEKLNYKLSFPSIGNVFHIVKIFYIYKICIRVQHIIFISDPHCLYLKQKYTRSRISGLNLKKKKKTQKKTFFFPLLDGKEFFLFLLL